MEAWFLHAVGDGSLVLARCRRWKLDHQVLLLDTMVAVTRGILPSQRAPTVAGGIALDRDLLLDTPVAVVLLPVSYFRFPNSRTHCERISERIANACSITKCCCWIPRWPSLVGSSQANELPRWPVASHDRSPSAAAAGYPGGRHSWNAELSWVPLRRFDRSPPMGTVATHERLSC